MYKNKSRKIIQYLQYITSSIHLNDNTKEMIGSKRFIIKHVILEYIKYKSHTFSFMQRLFKSCMEITNRSNLSKFHQ
jgi:hypothetical protein